MLGVIFLSFSFQMYADRAVLFKYFLFKNEFWGVYYLSEVFYFVCVCVCVFIIWVMFFVQL